MSSSGLFCEHKRLRTTCATCRPPPPPAPEKPPARATPKASAAAKTDEATAAARPTGPGKPLLPTRKPKSKGVSRKEAEQADAWWVKRG